MRKYSILPLFILILFAAGCSEDYGLQNSIFIEDLNNPGLPEYSEWGYNTFGAYLDRIPFVSKSIDLPSKIIVTKDTFNLVMKGQTEYENITLKFSIIGYSPADFRDLITLNDSTFDLTGSNCIVALTINGNSQILKIYEGEFVFKRVQKLYVDKEINESILSGTFNFKTFVDGEPTTFSNGRFDFGINYDNFFKF
jgi:hypothetical protein